MSAPNTPTPVVRGESPPFPELVGFRPVSAEAAPKPPTLIDRWSMLKPRTQIAVLATGLAVLAGGAMVLTPATDKELVRVAEVTPAPPPLPQPPQIETLAVENPLPRYYLTAKEVPLNLQVTPENLAEYFRQVEAKDAPDGTVLEEKTLLGKFAQRPLNASQFVHGRDFGFQPVSEPQPIVVERKPDAVREYTITDSKGSRLVRFEQWDGRWNLVTE